MSVTDRDIEREVENTYQATRRLKRMRQEAVMECLDKPLRFLLQLDTETGIGPDDYLMHPDDDRDATWWSWRHELRRCDIPVRVQIMNGTSQETALRALRRIVALLEGQPGLLAKGDEELTKALYPSQSPEDLPF